MSNFDPFMRRDVDAEAFPEAIEAGIEEAVESPDAPGRPEFDGFGLTPLGFAASSELGRIVAASDQSFAGNYPQANPLVPKWVRRGIQRFAGNYANPGPLNDFTGTLYDPYQEMILPMDYEAIIIAMNCINNGAGSVMDANFAARSILGMPEVDQGEPEDKVEVLRRSHGIVARLATLNDMDSDHLGRRQFNVFAGVTSVLSDAIDPERLVLDPDQQSVDFTDKAKDVISECSVDGRGCPALRKQVEYRGRTLPMIEAFWDGSVDVIAARITDDD